MKHELFDAVGKRSFGQNICFLCGCDLNESNRTNEHVIPRWAQERYKLWDQKVSLLNNTFIPYRQLTVPCCFECNNNHLEPIENAMAQAVLQGPRVVEDLGQKTIFIWLGKIFYGLLYKELFLQFDRTSKEKETNTDPELLLEYQMHHYFLQSVRVPMKFEQFFPASIMIFETQAPDDPKNQWDFHDSFNSLFVGCRMGRVGIIAVLQDGGAHMGYEDYFKDIKNMPLHPIQFRELMCMVNYKSGLFNRTPKYMIIDSDPVKVVQTPIAGFSTKPVYDDWDQETYANILSYITGTPLDFVFQPPDKVRTWLKNSDQAPIPMPLEQFPFPMAQTKKSPNHRVSADCDFDPIK